jgi:hypothetical protein
VAVNQDGRGGVYGGERDRRRMEAIRRGPKPPAGAIDGGQPVGTLLDKAGLGATQAQPWPVLTPTKPNP